MYILSFGNRSPPLLTNVLHFHTRIRQTIDSLYLLAYNIPSWSVWRKDRWYTEKVPSPTKKTTGLIPSLFGPYWLSFFVVVCREILGLLMHKVVSKIHQLKILGHGLKGNRKIFSNDTKVDGFTGFSLVDIKGFHKNSHIFDTNVGLSRKQKGRRREKRPLNY